jgi:hypothetical protein
MANNETGLTKLTPKVAKSTIRPDVRSDVREENPAERARQRAAEIRKHRAGIDLDSTDRFAFDTSIIPEGWSYEWKRKSIYNQEDPAYQIRLADGGWTPVPANRDARHAALMPTGNFATIERDGMILMERPKELTDEAKDIELRRARNQVRAKEAQLSTAPDGTLARDADPRTRPSVKKSYEAMPIPKE